jgi:rare lipoprotein A
MNQHRWTCLTVVLTTVLAPIANVHAKTLPSPAGFYTGDSRQFASRTLPIITPLTVTELQTDAAIPLGTVAVPQVSPLPEVTDRVPSSKLPARIFAPKVARKDRPNFVATPIFSGQNSTASFDPNFKLARLPDITPIQPLSDRPFTTETIGTPILVSPKGSTQPIAITNTATAQAEIAHLPQTDRTQPIAITNPTTAPPEIASLPQTAPDFNQFDYQPEPPTFVAGIPVFAFDSEKPQQIVATAIAQIGTTTAAMEPSVAIPVQRPKQLTIPTQLPIPDRSISNIGKPEEIVEPALDRIVATHTGQASWYGSEGGSKTANGERYNPNGLTAAHRTLPFGTKVRVTSLKTGKAVVVRINDRGPFHSRRIIDISAGAAQVIGLKSDGVGEVRMDVLGSL